MISIEPGDIAIYTAGTLAAELDVPLETMRYRIAKVYRYYQASLFSDDPVTVKLSGRWFRIVKLNQVTLLIETTEPQLWRNNPGT